MRESTQRMIGAIIVVLIVLYCAQKAAETQKQKDPQAVNESAKQTEPAQKPGIAAALKTAEEKAGGRDDHTAAVGAPNSFKQGATNKEPTEPSAATPPSQLAD